MNHRKTNSEMMDILKGMERNAVPPDLRFTWVQAPVKLEDALGRIIPVPSEYDWAVSKPRALC